MTEQKTGPSLDTLRERLRGELIPLFESAISDENVCFENPHLVVCKSQKNCVKEDCPCFEDRAQRCWQTAGTYCGGQIRGAFAKKSGNCRECDVFRSACPTIVEELGESLNNLLFLLRKKNRALTEEKRKAEYLNRELLSTVETLDAKNREIQELVITDRLTSLYNRHYLMISLEDEAYRCDRKSYTFSIVMLDIDDFKNINDTYGHLAGDAMLSKLGEVLKANIRNYDRCYRYGGEEFVVLLPETDLTMAWIVGERLRKGFQQEVFSFTRPEQDQTEEASCTLSVGCASYSPGLSIADLLKQSDEALYAAKSRGKNLVVRFDET
jgi:diguanylate cyclase (GGDEF)-like protein